MRSIKVQRFTPPRRAAFFVLFFLLTCGLLAITHSGEAQSQDGRARRTTTTTTPQQTPTPKASPSPKPGLVRPGTVVLSDDPPPEIANPLGAEIDEGGKVIVETDL